MLHLSSDSLSLLSLSTTVMLYYKISLSLQNSEERESERASESDSLSIGDLRRRERASERAREGPKERTHLERLTLLYPSDSESSLSPRSQRLF